MERFRITIAILAITACMSSSGISSAGTIAPAQPEDAKLAIVHEKKSDSSLTGIVDKTKKDAQKIEKTLGDYLKRLYLRGGGSIVKYRSKVKGLLNKKPKNGHFGGLGIGYLNADKTAALELFAFRDSEFQVQNGDNTLEAETTIYMVNLHQNLLRSQDWRKKHPVLGMIVPYFTAGVGAVHYGNTQYIVFFPIDGSTMQTLYKNKTSIAWNVGAGIKFDLMQNYSIDLGYKYLGLGRIAYNQSAKSSAISGHQYNLSLIAHF